MLVLVNFLRTALSIWVAEIAVDADTCGLVFGDVTKRMYTAHLFLAGILASSTSFLTIFVVGAVVVMSALYNAD